MGFFVCFFVAFSVQHRIGLWVKSTVNKLCEPVCEKLGSRECHLGFMTRFSNTKLWWWHLSYSSQVSLNDYSVGQPGAEPGSQTKFCGAQHQSDSLKSEFMEVFVWPTCEKHQGQGNFTLAAGSISVRPVIQVSWWSLNWKSKALTRIEPGTLSRFFSLQHQTSTAKSELTGKTDQLVMCQGGGNVTLASTVRMKSELEFLGMAVIDQLVCPARIFSFFVCIQTCLIMLPKFKAHLLGQSLLSSPQLGSSPAVSVSSVWSCRPNLKPIRSDRVCCLPHVLATVPKFLPHPCPLRPCLASESGLWFGQCWRVWYEVWGPVPMRHPSVCLSSGPVSSVTSTSLWVQLWDRSPQVRLTRVKRMSLWLLNQFLWCSGPNCDGQNLRIKTHKRVLRLLLHWIQKPGYISLVRQPGRPLSVFSASMGWPPEAGFQISVSQPNGLTCCLCVWTCFWLCSGVCFSKPHSVYGHASDRAPGSSSPSHAQSWLN